MELTDEEMKIILERRERQAKIQKDNASTLYIIKAAYNWEKWLQDNDAGSTYSTFCDDYGSFTGEHRSFVYRVLEDIRNLARHCASKTS